MKVTHEFSAIRDLDSPLSCAFGVFDGVHLGHREVILKAVEHARKHGGIAGVMTFDPFPLQVLAPDRAPQKILASISHKEKLLKELGVEFLLIIPFDRQIAQMGAEEFLEALYADGILAHISVGEDWKFGRGREGKLAFLRTYCEERGITLSATAPVIHEQERISSTRIRQAIRDGNLAGAAEMLGRNYTLYGRVVKGEQLGRQLGFPTANVDTLNELLPPHGVYVVRSQIRGREIYGVANLGVRPTVSGELKLSFEVHYFDLDEDLYDLELEVELGAFLRGEQKFKGIEELKAQITSDCQQARQLISSGSAWF